MCLAPHPSALAIALLTTVHAAARADGFGEMMMRVPEDANIVAMINVDAILESPMGKREKWREQAAERQSAVLNMPLEASKVLVTTRMDLGSAREHWKLGMAELRDAPPELDALAKAEGGYAEQVQAHNVVWTPRNFYVIAFPPRILAYVVPADRQMLNEWLRTTLVRPRAAAPAWARKAAARAERGSELSIAVNFENLISSKQAEAWLRTAEFMKDAGRDPRLLAPQLASLKSASLDVEIAQGIQGTLELEFDVEIKDLRPVAKALVLEAMANWGADIGDLRSWDGGVEGQSIKLSGDLSEPTLRRLIAAMGAPRLTPRYESQSEAPAPAADPRGGNEVAPPEPSQQSVVKASQQYFRSVVDITDALKQQRNENYSRIRMWLDRAARQIDELPILNVDAELLDWGSKVALTLRELSLNINAVNQQKRYNLASSPKGSYVGYWGWGSYNSVDTRSTNIQANSMINADANQRWTGLQTAIGEMRKKLVQKYGVDF